MQNTTIMADEVTGSAEVMYKLLIDAAQKFGVVGAIALFLVLVLSGLLVFMVIKMVSSYEKQMRVINDQNKEYQNYFLKNRRSSEHKFLGENKDKE